MALWALLKGNVVGNVIVVADDDKKFAGDYVQEDDNDFDAAFNVTTINPQPGVGWIKQGNTYKPPFLIVSSKDPIQGNDADVATVTYTDNRPGAPAQVNGEVNGHAITVALTNGVGTVDVTSANPGDSVIVKIGDGLISIGVQ